MTDTNRAANEDEVLGARAAQERLAEAFGPPRPPQDIREGDNVVALDDDEPHVPLDNPFAAEAAEALSLRRVEGLLFASAKPLSATFIADRVPGADVPALLAILEKQYRHRGVNLRCVDGKWQFVTAPDIVDVLVEERTQQRRLSRAALETLAIIAYHQPCSRAEIEEVRGVAVAKGSLDQLLELGWVRIRGRRDVPGRPLLYGTTAAFLEQFGLEDLNHLPGMADLKAAGLLEARLPADFQVPRPKGEDEDTDLIGDDDQAAAAEFAGDFHAEDE
jgi:segregation and condensation protein B